MPSAYNEVDEIIQDILVMGSFFTPGSGPHVLCQQMLHIVLPLSRYSSFNLVVQRLWTDFFQVVRLYRLHLDDPTAPELQYNNLAIIPVRQSGLRKTQEVNPIWDNPTLEEVITTELLSNYSICSGKDALAEGKEKDEDLFSEPLNGTNETWDKDDDRSTDNKNYVLVEASRRSRQQR